MRKWNKTPKGKEIKNKWHRKRRAMKYNIIEKFSHSQFMLKVKKYKGLCANCKEPFNEYDTLKILTIDHIYPISLANNDFKRTGIKRVYTIEDVEPLCMSCNCSKKASLKKESL
jgi:5-methylcytosine-specific restriction endonuclease McrA